MNTERTCDIVMSVFMVIVLILALIGWWQNHRSFLRWVAEQPKPRDPRLRRAMLERILNARLKL